MSRPRTVDMSRLVWALIARAHPDYVVTVISADGSETTHTITPDNWPRWVADYEERHAPRWVFSDSALIYPDLLKAGVRVARGHDLRLCHAILRNSAHADGSALHAATQWDVAALTDEPVRQAPALFDIDGGGARHAPLDRDEVRAEFDRQRTVLDQADGRLRLLILAESTGGLIAAELRAAGLPWSVTTHEQMLSETLGDRPLGGGPPPLMVQRAAEVRAALGDSTVSLDSHVQLLRALHRAGILVDSTSKSELEQHAHPAVAPLLEYKKLARLYSTNGWAWLLEWVRDDRFRPVYVPGGVVTGRWASSGGGALQIPRALRSAVRADYGWSLIVADVAQLEPRVLAAMSSDSAMAEAARGRDMYAGLVERNIVATRHEAKIAVLGAMYGSTTGESGRLVPKLRRAFPRAMALVDDAAHRGETGGTVSTLLGRTSPPVSIDWSSAQGSASEADADSGAEQRARRAARDRGRFTRNFIVQGTAAEWALVWLAEIRRGLQTLGVTHSERAVASGPAFDSVPHLALFLHDEVILHVPNDLADEAAHVVADAAERAGRLLFGDFPLDFPLDLQITQHAGG